MAKTMKAAVIYKAGGPDALKLEERPIPTPTEDQVLIKVHAFGLNRSELFTRQGLSPGVPFPRVLGIECCGTIASAHPSFPEGTVVASAMGGMGRMFDGGYAEYTCVPASHVQKIETKLPWETLGAMPEMFQTAWGSLFKALKLQAGDRLLVRGGTTSIGLTAAAIARKTGGIYVAGTTRNRASEKMMTESGMQRVFIDDGDIAAQIQASEQKFDKILELVGTTTLRDSLRCAKPGGLVCMLGMVGNKWSFEDFSPMEVIPHTVGLTVYGGGVPEFMETPLTQLCQWVEEGSLKVPVGKVFRLDDIVEAHLTMEENRAGGKIVVLT